MAKKKYEEHENHERWLVSYADFITLLFAFFVVMYSVSSVNEGKFRTVSDSIKAALNPIVSPANTAVPFTIGQNKALTVNPTIDNVKEPAVRRLRQIMHSLKNDTQLEIIQLKELTNGDIVLTLPDTVLFRVGEAVLLPEARQFIQAISEVLIELDRHVRIEGHTDNVPISTAQFPSNWELSATRAVTVVRTLSEQYGLQADHLTAVGHADSRPLADNLTPEHRAKNRRVEVVVQEPKPLPQPIEAAEPHTALERFAIPQDAVNREASTPPNGIPPTLQPPLPLIEPALGSGQRAK
ncbi:MAG TPA: flagellar motor protein MotB [Nitrospiraceae bacterium]|nr:flagellar motor protein MotB [Nitrospiraceae bacterium]